MTPKRPPNKQKTAGVKQASEAAPSTPNETELPTTMELALLTAIRGGKGDGEDVDEALRIYIRASRTLEFAKKLLCQTEANNPVGKLRQSNWESFLAGECSADSSSCILPILEGLSLEEAMKQSKISEEETLLKYLTAWFRGDLDDSSDLIPDQVIAAFRRSESSLKLAESNAHVWLDIFKRVGVTEDCLVWIKSIKRAAKSVHAKKAGQTSKLKNRRKH